MVVVPNHLTEQWAKDYLTLYPDANILSMTEADGTGKGAARFWAKVAAGDWDAVIVRQDTFQRMHVSPERREKYFERRKAEMLDSIETAKSDGNDFSAKKLKDEIGKMEKNLGKTVKQAEKDRMRVDGKLQALRDSGESKEWIDFEDLGVDMLFVDEAHQYKNLAIATTISVPGVDVAAAQKCEDLFDKCEYLREAGHGSNIVFATGTPVSNSMAELYNMQRYLAPDLLKAQGVEAFTSWANTYGSIVESVEVKPEGSGYQIKQRFAKFHNLPELMSTFHDYADLLTADQLDLDVPDCEVVSVAVEATEAQKQAVDALVERAELVRDGAVDPSDDNMLNITNDGRKVSLDPKLLDVSDPDIQPMEGGKVQVCAEKIHEIWREHAEEKATQLVFCDSSTTASGKWNIQSDLKRRLVDLGIRKTRSCSPRRKRIHRRNRPCSKKSAKARCACSSVRPAPWAPVRTCRTGSSPSTTSTALEARRTRTTPGPSPPAGQHVRQRAGLPVRHRRHIRQLHVPDGRAQGPVHQPDHELRLAITRSVRRGRTVLSLADMKPSPQETRTSPNVWNSRTSSPR